MGVATNDGMRIAFQSRHTYTFVHVHAHKGIIYELVCVYNTYVFVYGMAVASTVDMRNARNT